MTTGRTNQITILTQPAQGHRGVVSLLYICFITSSRTNALIVAQFFHRLPLLVFIGVIHVTVALTPTFVPLAVVVVAVGVVYKTVITLLIECWTIMLVALIVVDVVVTRGRVSFGT